MKPRVLGILLLLPGCTSWELGLRSQMPIPVGPLIAPEPIIMPLTPVPIGLNPPVPFVVNPELISRPRPRASTPPEPVPARSPNQEEDSKCIPTAVKHRGGDNLHDRCADLIPDNEFPGCDALLNGKNFDAKEKLAKVVWEVKTDDFDGYTTALKRIVLDKQIAEMRDERERAAACGFRFAV